MRPVHLVSSKQVKDAVLRWPALLSLSNRGPHAVASWLQGGLGLSAEDVGKMIKKNPAMVSCSIVHNLRPKLRCVVDAGRSWCFAVLEGALYNAPSLFGRRCACVFSRSRGCLHIARVICVSGPLGNSITVEQ